MVTSQPRAGPRFSQQWWFLYFITYCSNDHDNEQDEEDGEHMEADRWFLDDGEEEQADSPGFYKRVDAASPDTISDQTPVEFNFDLFILL